MSDTALIYGLVDPETGKVRYVGKTNNLKLRFSQHWSCSDVLPTHPKAIWFKTLKGKGLRPAFVELEQVDVQAIDDAEKKWIRFYTEQGSDLTNVMMMLRYEVGSGTTTDRERLVVFADQNSLSSSDLALVMDLAVSGISQFLTGKKPITDGFRWRFAATFGWEVATVIFPFEQTQDDE